MKSDDADDNYDQKGDHIECTLKEIGMSNCHTPTTPILLGHHTLQKVFHQDGNIIGQIVTFNALSELAKDVPKKKIYQKTSHGVGRIFVKYHVPGIVEPVWQCGTGFCIKKGIVMSAGHVFTFKVDKNAPIETQEMQKNLKYQKIYIYFGPHASLDVDGLPVSMDNFYELESLGRDFDQKFKAPLSSTDLNGKTFHWNPANDLEVLKFKEKPPKHVKILLPMLPTNPQAVDHYVMGYPGFVTLDKFKADYDVSSVKLGLESLYIEVVKGTRYFENKTVFIGKVVKIENNVITHLCPTLAGTSGGILANTEQKRKFVGVHLGGSQEIGNIAISVTHPLFWDIYETYVLKNDDKFIKKNLKHLKEYLIYFNYIKLNKEKIN
ncbi:hypothetical protein PPL_06621 [Heterostelium album PN500]|uniref:Serine protease n=1 Tax=Heterostelium pallidum (strain ATCC 26659 / Pp 5 / PN500) TaxID=670386 RepID=D3BF88_HETP5|nr:hypothetical protein PPL_06621 [Heterostelium album PN500]EFA79802.1 hypothetical protein PPL_06621 [Heterostelium album PN500]|eukprot:XP_020431923.1 hypothetical protein PPL_06621 [Heterostelium album PN500]